MSIGSRIKEQRIILGLTQPGLANKIDMSLDSVKKLETDRVKPSIETLIKLCDLFNVKADYLLGRESESIEEKRNKLRKIADVMNELIQYVQDNERLPPKEAGRMYFDILKTYNFDSGTKPFYFLKDPINHAKFILDKINVEFEKLDKIESNKK